MLTMNMHMDTAMPRRITELYIDGFKNMRVGRELWLLIGFKLLIIFGVMKLFFFPDVLKTKFSTDDQRSAYVLKHLTKE